MRVLATKYKDPLSGSSALYLGDLEPKDIIHSRCCYSLWNEATSEESSQYWVNLENSLPESYRPNINRPFTEREVANAEVFYTNPDSGGFSRDYLTCLILKLLTLSTESYNGNNVLEGLEQIHRERLELKKYMESTPVIARDNNWTTSMRVSCAKLGVTPEFLLHHFN